MPNWCSNTLTLRGKEKELMEFEKKVKANDYNLLSTFIPIPAELIATEHPNRLSKKEVKALIKKYDAEDWYQWSIKNWGCKWDCKLDTVLLEQIKGMKIHKLKYEFSSPWGPPIAGIDTISKLYPNIEFSLNYDEPGMRFRGNWIVKNGTTKKDTSREY